VTGQYEVKNVSDTYAKFVLHDLRIPRYVSLSPGGALRVTTLWHLSTIAQEMARRGVLRVTHVGVLGHIVSWDNLVYGDRDLPVFVSSSALDVVVGVYFSYTIVTSLDIYVAFMVSGLPVGVVFDGVATISGTISTPGAYAVIVSALVPSTHTTATLTIAVAASQAPVDINVSMTQSTDPGVPVWNLVLSSIPHDVRGWVTLREVGAASSAWGTAFNGADSSTFSRNPLIYSGYQGEPPRVYTGQWFIRVTTVDGVLKDYPPFTVTYTILDVPVVSVT